MLYDAENMVKLRKKMGLFRIQYAACCIIVQISKKYFDLKIFFGKSLFYAKI